jgi:hypothetical protein
MHVVCMSVLSLMCADGLVQHAGDALH